MSAVKSTLIEIQQEREELRHREARMEQPHLETKTLDPYTTASAAVLQSAASRLCPDEFAFVSQDQLLAAAINEQRKITPDYTPKLRGMSQDEEAEYKRLRTAPVAELRTAALNGMSAGEEREILTRFLMRNAPEFYKKWRMEGIAYRDKLRKLDRQAAIDDATRQLAGDEGRRADEYKRRIKERI